MLTTTEQMTQKSPQSDWDCAAFISTTNANDFFVHSRPATQKLQQTTWQTEPLSRAAILHTEILDSDPMGYKQMNSNVVAKFDGYFRFE